MDTIISPETQKQIVETLKTLSLKIGGLSESAWDILVKGQYVHGIYGVVGIVLLFTLWFGWGVFVLVAFKKEKVKENEWGVPISIISAIFGIFTLVVSGILIIESMKFFIPEYYALKEIIKII